MARDAVGASAVTNLFEAAAWMYTIKASCTCGNASVFHPHALWWRFHRTGWDLGLRAAAGRFYCRACWQKHCRKVRPVKLQPVKESPTVHLPLPSDHEWKRAVNRFRG